MQILETALFRLSIVSVVALHHHHHNRWECLLTTIIVTCRVRLSKRRAKAGAQSTTNAVLVCKHRDMNEKELEAQVSLFFMSWSL